MNVALVNLPYPVQVVREGRCQHEAAIWDTVYPPLELAILAALLKKDHDVLLIDAVGEKLTNAQTISRLKGFGPDWVFCPVSTPTIDHDLKILKEIKEIFPKIKSGIFGVHATYFSETLAQSPAVDYAIKFDPENAISDLVKGNTPGGVTFNNEGKIVTTPLSASVDLDGLPTPAWDLIKKENYILPIVRKPYVLMETGRGCPYRCVFCVVPYFHGKKPRMKSVDKIIQELTEIRTFVKDVFFHTDNFTFDPEYVKQFCRALIASKLDFKWVCNSRVDTIDDEMVRLMKEAGCWLMSFGIESGDQDILDHSKKGITLSQSRTAISIVKKNGLMASGHFIFGLPGETNETAKRTLEFAKSLPLDFAEFYIATPFPGSELYESIKEKIPLTWDAIGYDKDPYGIDIDLRKVKKQGYREFYLRPSQMISMARAFGSRSFPYLAMSGFRFLRATLLKK